MARLCQFKAPDKQPCPAYADDRNPRGNCFAHDEIYLHDCAVVFRKKARKDEGTAERWAVALALPVERIKQIAGQLRYGEQIILVDVQ
jgi:hypothetical protein